MSVEKSDQQSLLGPSSYSSPQQPCYPPPPVTPIHGYQQGSI
jgi:hypothetical protein